MKKFNKAFTAKAQVALLLLLCICIYNKGSAQIAGWDVSTLSGGTNNFGPSPYSATLTSSYVTVGGLTRGPGVTTAGTGAARAWGGTSWTSSSAAAAIVAGDYITCTIRIDSAYPVSFTSISPFDYRRSNTGPDTGLIEYSINGINFFPISSVSYSSLATTGASLNSINLSTISALQNVSTGTTVTFRIVNWRNAPGGSSGGTWYIFDRAASTANDFQINGTVPLYFRSVTTGNWNSASTWEVSSTGAAPWNPAYISPSSNAYSIEVQTGHQVALPAFQAVGRLLITNGTLTGSASTSMAISGTASALRFTPGGTSNYLRNFAVIASGNVTLANALNISAGASYGTVTTSASLNANGFLTLKSDALGTARIGISTANSVTGNVTIERFIPSKRTWRLLGPPHATSAQTLNTAWQGGNTNSTLVCANNGGTPGYDMHLTWNGSGGYDLNTTSNPSVMYWNGSVWTPPASTSGINILNYPGYMAFVRGDRTICLSSGVGAGSTATTLRTAGTLNTGSVTKSYTGLTPGQIVVVSNPYASSINLASVTFVGFTNTRYVWDPSSSFGTYGYGGWVSANGATITPGPTTNYPDAPSVRIIQSGQAFAVEAMSTSATIVFSETDKTTSQSSTVFARPVSHVRTKLVSLGSTTEQVVDGVVIRFDSLENENARKLFGFYENLYLKKGADSFVIESRNLSPSKNDTFFVEMRGIRLQQYRLDINEELLDVKASIRFVDKFTGVDIELKERLSHVFSVTTDTASYKNRFMLIVKEKPAKVPPKQQREFVVFPNPTKGDLRITIEGKSYSGSVVVTDLSGRQVYRSFVSNGTFNCSLAPGLYLLSVGGQIVKFSKL